MREDDERFIENIKDIIDKVVGIEEGDYSWGGQQYNLTNTDKAAREIFYLMMNNQNAKTKELEAYRITKGSIEIHPKTFQPLLPVTIYLPLETIQDSLYNMGEEELITIIGTEIINSLGLKTSRNPNESKM